MTHEFGNSNYSSARADYQSFQSFRDDFVRQFFGVPPWPEQYTQQHEQTKRDKSVKYYRTKADIERAYLNASISERGQIKQFIEANSYLLSQCYFFIASIERDGIVPPFKKFCGGCGLNPSDGISWSDFILTIKAYQDVKNNPPIQPNQTKSNPPIAGLIESKLSQQVKQSKAAPKRVKVGGKRYRTKGTKDDSNGDSPNTAGV